MYGENGELEYGGNDKYKYLPKEGVEEWEDQYFKSNNVDKFIDIDYKIKFLKKEVQSSDIKFYKPPDPNLVSNLKLKCIGCPIIRNGYLRKIIITFKQWFRPNQMEDLLVHMKYTSLDIC